MGVRSRPPRRRPIQVAVVAALVLAVVSGSVASTGVDAQAPGRVRIAITQNDKNWTPYTYQTGYPGYNVLTIMYDTLLWHDKDNKIVPWLASDYKVSPDGLTVDVTIRDNAKWHDGRPLTADDVKFTYDYILQFNHGRFTPEVKGIVDTTTVTAPNKVAFRLKRPFAPFLTAPLGDVTILPKHIWEGISENYPSPKGEQGLAVGSGPYKMVEYVPDKQYRLVANPDYFMGKPAVEELVLPIIPDSNAQILALRGGEVDAVASNLAPELVKELGNAPGIKVATGVDYTTSAVTMNASKAPFDQPKFRQAVGFATDVEGLVSQVLAGFGTPGSPGFVHPDSPFYKKGLRHEFDLAKANSLLDELGFREKDPDGTRRSADGKVLQFGVLANSGNPIEVRTAEVFGSMLGKAGIKATVISLTGAAKAARTGGFGGQNPDRDFDFNMSGATAPVQDDPDRLRTILETWTPQNPTLNAGKWSNPQFDELLRRASSELDQSKRLELLGELQEIITNDRPNVVLFYRNGAYAYRTGAYDDWAYVKGKGIVDKVSFLPASAAGREQPAARGAEEGGGSDGGSQTGLLVAVLAVAALAGGGLFLRRRKGAEQE